ncbi:MAG: winged helix-turn-helix transcriptional regulator [Thermoleophilia bacterium]
MSRPVLELSLCDAVARVFEILGKRWSGLLVDLLLQRPARFKELARAVPGLSERVLSQRLRELEEAGLVKRRVDTGPPIAVTYSLTPLGRGLEPALDALREWAHKLPDAH